MPSRRRLDALSLFALLGLAGCVIHGTPTDAMLASASVQAQVPCPAEAITVSNRVKINDNRWTWTATCSAGTFSCDGEQTNVRCTPGAAGARPGPVIASEADLNAALARENANLAPAKVGGPDWKAEVLAAGPVTVESQNGLPAVVIPIGSEEPVRCMLLGPDADAMAGLTGGLTSIHQETKGALQRVVPSPILVAQEAPAMFVSTIFGAGNQVNLFKFAIHAHAGHPVLCVNQGLGYVHTFQAACMRLFETLDRGQPAPAPQLVEVSRITVDGLDWGFSRLTISKNAEAAWVQDTETALLVPGSATDFGSEFRSELESSEELIDSHGRLVRGAWGKAAGKTLVHKLKLSARDKRGTYDYEGEVGGKPVKGELRSHDPHGGVASSLAAVLRLRGLAGKPAALDIKQEEYIPEIDPTRLTETRYTRTKSDPGGQLKVIAGQREAGAVVDADGRTRDVTFKAGASTIRIERIFARGKL